MAEGEGEGLQQRDERTGRAGEAGAGAALCVCGGGGGLRQRTCGGVEHGAAAAPAPSGRGGKFWRGRARVSPAANKEKGRRRKQGGRGGGTWGGGGGTSLPPDAGGSSSVACRGSGRDQWPMSGRLGRTAAKIA